MRRNAGVVTEKNIGDRRKGCFTHFEIYEGLAAIGGFGDVNLGRIAGGAAAIIKNKIEIAGDLIHRHPHEELVAVRGVIIDLLDWPPGLSAIGGFNQKNVGIVAALTLIRPRDIDVAAIF
ncbi:MAG: hypothetical protein ALAOOOJD_00580 [bacterium]|nr:hypothetical protein [bacterium]